MNASRLTPEVKPMVEKYPSDKFSENLNLFSIRRRENVKKRLLSILITVVLIVLMTPTVFANSSAPPEAVGNAGTEVKAKADSIYVFAAPPSGMTITYPQTQLILGNFIVNDLFLESGEWLTLTVIPGVMTNIFNPGLTLPYQVSFNPPATLNAANIGETYGASIVIAPEVLENAPAGKYQAVLRFRVISHPQQIVVWESLTTVIVKKQGQEESTPSSEPVYSSEVISSQVTSSSIPTVPSKASTPSKVSTSSIVTIEPEQTLGQTPDMGTILKMYGFPLAALIVMSLFILLYLIGRSRSRKNQD